MIVVATRLTSLRDAQRTVGTYELASETQLTFLEHWDGHVWKVVSNPNPGQPVPLGGKKYDEDWSNQM